VHGVPRFGHQRQPRLHGSQLLLNSRGLCDTTKISGYPEDIADYLDRDEYHVRKALIWLEAEQTAQVHSFIQEGRRRFFQLNPQLEDIEYGSDWEPPEDWDPFGMEDN